ncbi:response regulator [Variovorax sp. GB1R11]|uniref:response regulator n=1 Tax=Variovorax sp. GB1R11 TaxID=3443741 RepID=UPI003F4474C2
MTIRSVILVVDDEPTSADLLGMILEMHYPEATICVAHSAKAALALARRQRPHVAISDLEMPVMDGEAFALALRASFPSESPLLIALSGNVLRLAAMRGTSTFDHHLTKPVDMLHLARLLESSLDS